MENSKSPSLKDLVKSLILVIEEKDPFMKAHAERVALNCLRFSKTLRLDQSEMNHIYLAGLLHDIGFIFLPLDIVQRRSEALHKNSDIIKRHPLISEKIVSKHAILKGTLPIIRHHHESVDGSGYPDGLKEKEIPIGAKILNLINCFDLLTASGPGHTPMDTDSALAEILKDAGKTFDKNLVESFITFIKSPEIAATETMKDNRAAADTENDKMKSEVKNQDAGQIAADQIIEEIINKYKNDEIELPILSNVVHEIQKVINNPATTIDDLASIIERDAVISVRLISVANSPIYRGSEKVVTVKHAIPRIGVKETHSIVTTISNKSLYNTRDKAFKDIMERLWLHSLASGYIAKALSSELKLGESEKYYFMGLVHDIGKVLLVKTFGDLHAKNNLLDINFIMEAIKEAHTSFGGAILRKWGFSEALVRIPLRHEGPDFRLDTDKEILTINLASNIADNIGYGLKEDVCHDPSRLKSARFLDADPGMIEDISQQIKGVMEDISQIF